MKKLLLIFCCIFLFSVKSQNGFTTYTTNLTLSGTIIKESALLVDNTGNKWIGFSTPISAGVNVGLVKYNGSTWTLYNTTSTPALPSNYISALVKDNAGNIWIGTRAGLVKFDGVNFTTYNTINGLPSNTITCIESVGSQIYVGTRFGLSRYDGVNFTNYTRANGEIPSDTITSIKAESNNMLWLGGYNRLVRFDINSTFTISSYTNNIITPSSGMINCIFIDGTNTKWLGTSTVGALMYSGASFVNANSIYSIYGSAIPNAVFDISLGLNNGVALKMVNSSNVSTGIIELAPNSLVHQYFSTLPTFSMGDYIDNDGTNLVISQNGSGSVYTTGTPKIYYSFDKTNYSSPLGTINVNNFKTLEINNVKAGIANRGDMHWDIGGAGNAMYEVPKGSGLSSNFASALWIGGLDNGNQLHGGAQTYRQGGVDFWPGPLDTISGTIDTLTSKNYDKIWKVSYTDINTFITAYNSGSVVATPDMLSWPAHGTGNNARNLAPFVDYNLDENYNPADGDYPKIKGDQALYFIYNDNLATHGTSFTSMGIEVQGMAYALVAQQL